MFSLLLRPARQIAKALIDNDTTHQLALALVLGMMLGLVPKGNLTAILLGVLLFSTKVNLSVGLAAAGLFTWIGWGLDPVAHRLGWMVLTFEPLQRCYAWFFDLAVVPWTGLNNSVVVGQLLIGAYLAYPTYWLGKVAFPRLRPRLAARIKKYRVTRYLFGIELGVRLGPGG